MNPLIGSLLVTIAMAVLVIIYGVGGEIGESNVASESAVVSELADVDELTELGKAIIGEDDTALIESQTHIAEDQASSQSFGSFNFVNISALLSPANYLTASEPSGEGEPEFKSSPGLEALTVNLVESTLLFFIFLIWWVATQILMVLAFTAYQAWRKGGWSKVKLKYPS